MSFKLERTLSALVQKALKLLRGRTLIDDGEELRIPEDAESLSQQLLELADIYFELDPKDEYFRSNPKKGRKLANFGETESSVKSATRNIRAAAKDIARLNKSRLATRYRIFAEANEDDQALTHIKQLENLPRLLEAHADWIDMELSESKKDRFRTRNRDGIKRSLIACAGDANYGLLSEFLRQFADSKGIEITDKEYNESLGEEALRKFAKRSDASRKEK